MLIEIILALLTGILAGTITGIIPGIHINLIGSIIVTLTATALYTINPIFIITFITAMAITHTFLDFIPSIFLGCPDTDTELGILPGHKFLKKGLGFPAIVLTTQGSAYAIFLFIIITIPTIFLLPKIYPIIKTFIPYFLIIISLTLILTEKRKRKSLLIFIITGILGTIILNNQNITEPLLPMLTGLFGASILITSIKNKTQIPKQRIIFPKSKKTKPILGALIAAPLCSLLPSLGASQGAIIGNTITKIRDPKEFLILIGATNTLVMAFSFLTLFLIQKTRTGAAAAVKSIINQPTTQIITLIIITTIITSFIAFHLTISIGKIASKKVHKINYTYASLTTLTILTILILIFTGPIGILIFTTSTLIGIYTTYSNIRKTNMMGCLIIPTIIFYLTN